MNGGLGIGTGIFKDNPMFSLFLGLCPALAVSTRLSHALVLSIAILCVMPASALLIQPLRMTLGRTRIGARTRTLLSVMVIGVCVTAADLLLAAWLPEERRAIGFYLPVTAANCLLFGRTALFSWNARGRKAVADALGLAIGFAAALVLLAAFRELLGEGTLTLLPMGTFKGRMDLRSISEAPARLLVLPAGGLLALGYLVGLARLLFDRKKQPAGNGTAAPAGDGALFAPREEGK